MARAAKRAIRSAVKGAVRFVKEKPLREPRDKAVDAALEFLREKPLREPILRGTTKVAKALFPNPIQSFTSGSKKGKKSSRRLPVASPHSIKGRRKK
jgi:hypothetical protein